MRWPVFAIAAYFALVLQVGLAHHLALGGAAPEFVLLLAVFVALSAPTRTTVIACGILGLLLDLAAAPYTIAASDTSASTAVTLIGPYALGYMAGGYLVVQLRPMLFRDHPLTLSAMTLAAGAEAHLIVVGLLWLRNWYEPLQGFVATQALMPRGLGLVYTAVLAAAIAYPLAWIAPLFGFHAAHPSARDRR